MSDRGGEPKASRWQVPAIDGSSGPGVLTAGRLQELQKQAYDEAYEKGMADGIAAGQKEIAERAARYDQLLQALCEPFDQLDDSVESQLVELTIALVKQLFRREIKLDPSHVIGVVREAIQALPVASRNIEVHLHPDDATLIRESLAPSEGETAWRVVEDPLMSRGGCRVTTDAAQIDASAEARLQAVISRCLGDERHR